MFPRARHVPLIVFGLGVATNGAAQSAAADIQLPAVTVTGADVEQTATGPVQGFVANRAVTATKTDTPVMETPQSISIITQDRMTLQGAQSVQQAAAYTAGVTAGAFGPDNRGDSIKIRGTDSTQYLDGLLNAVGSYNNTRPDPYALERIEILRGPSAMLYGQGAIGGIVNQVSKRPQPEAMREIGVSYGNHNRKQIQADLTGPIDADGKWLYRVVALGRDSDSSVKHVDDDRYFIAPSLTYRPSAATSLTLLANFQKDNTGSMVGFFPWRGTLTSTPAGRIPQDFFVSEPDFDKYTARQSAIGYQFEHAFNDAVTVRQNLRYTHSEVDYRSIYTAGFNGAGHGWVPGSDTLLRRVMYQNQPTLKQFAVDTQGQFKFQTGPIRHTLLTGIDYQRSVLDARQGVGGTVAPIDVHNPVYGNFTPPTGTVNAPTSRGNQLGLYMQDQLEWEKWLLMLGLRHDRSRASVDDTPSGSRDDSEVSKRFGLMYRSEAGLNPYLSYSESFQGQAGFNRSNQAYKPLRGKQWEVGLKYQPPGSSSLYTASLFHITQENVATKEPQDNFYTSVGEIRSQGLELEAHIQATQNLKLLGSYTYTDITYSKALDGNQGHTPNQAPKHMASVWADYAFDAGPLDGLSIGGGARYVGETWADKENTLRVPDYTLVDARIGYDLGKLGMKGLDVSLNANNLLDKDYVASCYNLDYCYFGEKRNVTATVNYQF
ncbi:MAG: TonB-dependent siderophore receptor [Achromobacter sp.]|nr:TonB-dependent siderophore receptor [Achromobacter sp.]